MRSIWTIRGENRASSISGKQQSKTSRTGKRAIQLAGFAVEGLASAKPGSLGLDLPFLFLSSLPEWRRGL